MKTALDAPLDLLDKGEQSFVEKVRQYGWFDTHVVAEVGKPGFSYSTGFWAGLQRPEWIVFGLRREIAHQLLWERFRDVHLDQKFEVGKRSDSIFANNIAYIFPVARKYYPSYLGWSRWFYGGDNFPCFQIVWPDRAGLFPWESGYDAAFRDDQIDLTAQGWRAALAD